MTPLTTKHLIHPAFLRLIKNGMNKADSGMLHTLVVLTSQFCIAKQSMVRQNPGHLRDDQALNKEKTHTQWCPKPSFWEAQQPLLILHILSPPPSQPVSLAYWMKCSFSFPLL